MLPDTQHPFGSGCDLSRELQAVLFHYGVRPQDAAILSEEAITTIQFVGFADPDGAPDERDLFKLAVADRVQGPLHKLVLKKVFRRILGPNPFAAVVAAAAPPPPPPTVAATPPPSKKAKSVGAPTASSASSVAVSPPDPSSSTSATASPTASSSKASVGAVSAKPRKTPSDVSDSDSDDLAKTDGDASASDDAQKKSKRRSLDLASLFDEVDSEVRDLGRLCLGGGV